MGLDVQMIGGHRLGGDLYSIAARVPQLLSETYHDNILSARIQPIIRPEYFKEWTPYSWELDLAGLPSLDEKVRTDKCVGFDGPLGLSIRFGLYSFSMHNHFRWRQFLEDEDLRERLLKLMRHVLIVLGGEEFVVVPDNATRTSGFDAWIMKPATFAEIKQGLISEVGHPSQSAEHLALQQSSDSDHDGYLLYSAASW